MMSVTNVDNKQPSTLRTDELDYHLPPELIATRPAEPRDAARMLVAYRSTGAVEHRQVRDLPEYLKSGDSLVFNTTAVTPARLIGERADTAGRVEGLYLGEREGTPTEPSLWQVMLKSNGKLRPGVRIILLDAAEQPSDYTLELIERAEGLWLAHLRDEADAMPATASVLDRVGRTPLPPYILRTRGNHFIADALDRLWYQTVFASVDVSHRQSVAAPTAGLHFTDELLAQLAAQGVQRLDVLLHVGAGTFKPVTAETLAEHVMHTEHFEVPAATLAALARSRRERTGRIIAVGTTTVRTLESLPDPLPVPFVDGPSLQGDTNLLIAPPHEFRHVDVLLTNFHLPRSTLLALVGAMIGLDRLKAVYAEAIDRNYRFYSYGDAMLILP